MPAATERSTPRSTPSGRTTHVRWLAVLVSVLVLVILASLAFGVRDVPLSDVLQAIIHRSPSNNDQGVILDQRLPRTVIGILGGAALAVAGALLQGLTRNPIADPGLLGINAGASLGAITAIGVFGLSSPSSYGWFAFAGAAVAASLVYGLAAVGFEAGTPVKLVLIGAALTATTNAVINLVLITNPQVLQEFRFWEVGSLLNPDGRILVVAGPSVAVGLVLALLSARFLNATALGDDVARALGQSPWRGRTLVLVAVVLLSGAATALVGPILFVGLMVPHAVRLLVGGDYRWVLRYSLIGGPLLLLSADIVGRFLLPSGELEAGLVVAVIGAPVLIALIRRQRAVAM